MVSLTMPENKQSVYPRIIGCLVICGVLFVLCSGVAVLFPQLGVAIFEYAFDRYPVYDGMALQVSSGEVYEIYLSRRKTPLPNSFFILICGAPTNLRDITGPDLVKIGFNADSSTIYRSPGSTLNFDLATFDSKGLERLSISTYRVQFSASEDGPFLTLPVSMKEFEKQFGAPKTYRRGGGMKRYGP